MHPMTNILIPAESPGTAVPGLSGVRFIAFAAMLFAVVGCGGDDRFDLAGEVTHKGKPIPAGTLVFDPDTARGGDGPQGFAHIKQGKFDTRESGRKVMKGAALVRVQGFDGNQGKPGKESTLGNPLFNEFQQQVELAPDRPTLNIDVK